MVVDFYSTPSVQNHDTGQVNLTNLNIYHVKTILSPCRFPCNGLVNGYTRVCCLQTQSGLKITPLVVLIRQQNETTTKQTPEIQHRKVI